MIALKTDLVVRLISKRVDYTQFNVNIALVALRSIYNYVICDV